MLKMPAIGKITCFLVGTSAADVRPRSYFRQRHQMDGGVIDIGNIILQYSLYTDLERQVMLHRILIVSALVVFFMLAPRFISTIKSISLRSNR